jgi:hypothetical protein
MKRIFQRLTTFVLSVMLISTICILPTSAATTVKLDTTSYTFDGIGKSYIVLATTSSSSAKMNYSSNNSSVAIVQPTTHSGNKYYFKITSKGYGCTKINITADGVTSSMLATVNNGIDLNTIFDKPSLFAFDTNSANGVRIALMANYKGSKTINYYTVNFSAYNAVGDPIVDEITGKSKFSIKAVGPVQTGEPICLYDIFAYSAVCSKIVIDSIDIQYADGTNVTGTYPYSTTQNTDDGIAKLAGTK